MTILPPDFESPGANNGLIPRHRPSVLGWLVSCVVRTVLRTAVMSLLFGGVAWWLFPAAVTAAVAGYFGNGLPMLPVEDLQEVVAGLIESNPVTKN